MDVDTKTLLLAIENLRFQMLIVQLAAAIYVGEKIGMTFFNLYQARQMAKKQKEYDTVTVDLVFTK